MTATIVMMSAAQSKKKQSESRQAIPEVRTNAKTNDGSIPLFLFLFGFSGLTLHDSWVLPMVPSHIKQSTVTIVTMRAAQVQKKMTDQFQAN